MFRRLLLGAIVGSLGAAGCAGNKQASLPDTGPSSVRLPLKASLYVRSTFDADGTALIGAFIPDDVTQEQIDESNAARTRCSDYIRPKVVKAGGRTNEVFSANQSFGGSAGLKGIASLKGEQSDSSALRIDYELMEKLAVDVDQSGLQQCCRAYPDQCTKRYIASAVRGKGYIYAASEKATNVGAEGEGTMQSIPFGASAFYKDGLKWERRTDFDGQFFAFGLARYMAQAQLAQCSWVNRPPQSLDGEYFIGVATPRTTEQEARENAIENAELQVIAYVGKYLAQQSASAQSSSGPAAEIQTQFKDERTVERMTQGLAQFVKMEDFCPGEERTPTGLRHTMKALAFLPKEQKLAAARLSITNLMSAMEEQNKLTAARKAQFERILADLK